MNGTGVEDDNKNLKKTTFTAPPQTYTGVPTEEYNDDRDREKPWQRVMYEITRKGLHLYEPVKSVPSALIILLLGLYLLLGYLTQLIEDDMPRVVRESDVARDDWQTFSEESALKYLQQIVGDEPRVAGTKYHLQKTEDMLAIVNNIAAQAVLPVKTDWQMVTGDFWLNFSMPFVNYYQNVSNIIAVLEGESGFNADGTTRASLLVNCHYDSVPYALGASDNAVFCAVMAECLARMSRRNNKFRHNIVFLFNGAEENPLQAGHAFLQHPWSKGVTAVINLDAAGMNGKPSVFQVTDPRILNAYRRSVRRPSSQGVGEFLFSSGIIPSDTDFRIFRDFGNIQGIDVAFTKWGHVYHTRYDHPSLILPGVIQNAGDMLLATVADAAQQNLDEKMAATPMVYFDYLNLFMVSYSHPVSHALDVLVALFALLSVAYYIWLVGPRWSTVRELSLAVMGRLVSLAAGVVVVAVLVPIMVATTIQMRYLTEPWVVVPMFWIPYLVGSVAAAHLFDAWRTKKTGLNRSIRTLQAMSATRTILAAVLLILSCIPQATPLRYVVAVPLFTMSAAALVSVTVVRYIRLQGWQHLLLEFVLSIPSCMFMMMLSLRLLAMMLPIMGRAGGDTPDYTVAVINLGMAVLTGVTMSGTELLFSRRRLWVPLSVLLVSCAVIMLVPFSPYRDHGPSTQRHYWFHSEIVSYNADKIPTERISGVLVTKHDPYTTERVVPELERRGVRLNTRQDFDDDCRTKVLCNLPLYRVAFSKLLPQSLWLYAGGPAAFSPAPDVTLTNRSCAGDVCQYYLHVTVAPHNLITICPRPNVTLEAWSLSSQATPSFRLAGRPVYLIVHSAATYSEKLEPIRLTVTLKVPQSLQSQPALDLSHHAHRIHHPQFYTAEYKSLLDAAPKYFNIASFMSIRSNYVF